MFLGWIFFWPFLDKVFGLGFTTKAEQAWLNGGSPTTGFLKFGTKGPFADMFQNLAGNMFVDWIFMLGLLGIGIALILGIGMRIASYSGALMLLLMYFAVIPPEHNPFLDEHIIYALVLLILPMLGAGHHFGLGKWWNNMAPVKRFPIFE
ncbi:MAG: hypothetical protein Q8P37_01345 [Candidatus Spechtbacteria bacterium]|nr:hypothetical protein [Candidatus Spechtbacteria bacterium]